MTTPIPLADLYALCREFEAARDTPMLKDISVNYITNTGIPEYYCEGLLLSPAAVRDILENRLWKAVMQWCQTNTHHISVSHNTGEYLLFNDLADEVLCEDADLPAAARAIVEWERARQPTAP